MFELDNVKNEAILRDFFIFQSWTSRTQQFCETSSILKLTTSKTKQVCETSSFFELDNIQNEAILRDFFNFWTWQHQKRSNSARLPSKMESWVQSWQPRTNAFCDFSSPPAESTAPATKKSCQVTRSAAPVTPNHLSKPQDLMLQNATPLRKSPPRPPNSSDEDVSCSAPATENASLQILFKCPTPAIVFGNATKTSRFAHFWEGAPCLAPATRNDIWTSKSGAYMLCFVHFDFEMCFAPQRRALFRHLNFQKWSEAVVLCTFWLRNVLRATTACTFSTSQLPKVVRSWCVLYMSTSKCSSRHNGLQFFISHLASWLRTRRFSEPTFRPSGATNHWKNIVFRDFPSFSRICIFFFWLFLFSDLFSSLIFSLPLFSSLRLSPSLLFICPYCRKFDF